MRKTTKIIQSTVNLKAKLLLTMTAKITTTKSIKTASWSYQIISLNNLVKLQKRKDKVLLSHNLINKLIERKRIPLNASLNNL